MSHNHTPMIELTLTVRTQDENSAASVSEKLARIALGLSAERGVSASTDYDRYEVHCHEHDEAETP